MKRKVDKMLEMVSVETIIVITMDIVMIWLG